MSSKNPWDITKRPHTKNKLEIVQKVFGMWLTIWGAQKWAAKEWYVMDLFAGQGYYKDKGKKVGGSPLIFLEQVLSQASKLKKNNIKVKLFFVEIDEKNYRQLEKAIKEFAKKHTIIKDITEVHFYNNDCNKAIADILKKVKNKEQNPLFVFIDPSGLQIKKPTLAKIAKLENRKDIMLNYMLEGVRRTGGIIKKEHLGVELSKREEKTKDVLEKFLGQDIKVIGRNDREILEDYVSVFTNKGLGVVGYDMPYPDRKDVLYYLLFASRKATITKIVQDIYYRQKKKGAKQKTLFGEKYEKESILTLDSKSKVLPIKRKSLLYKTKVEYGDWTINHIIGCMHGCNFPCYAMRMAQKFGWVKDYEDWRKPRIAVNAIDLLDKEIAKHKNEIEHFVHLCFMSDPFMYDCETEKLVPEIKELTLRIIEKLNRAGIKTTTLTKGFYPDEVLDKKKFLKTNEYGITLVSLNENFKKAYEPFSAPYKARIGSLKKLAKAGLRTWVSMEPYPTPKLPKLNKTSAENIEGILEKISFVQKIVFGKLNYSRLNYCNGNYSQSWEKNGDDFYKEMAQKVIDFCKKNDIEYHIKRGTPLSKESTANIFRS